MMRKLLKWPRPRSSISKARFKESLAYTRLSALTDIKLKAVMDSAVITPEDQEKF